VFNDEPIVGKSYIHAPYGVRTFKHRNCIIHLANKSSLFNVGKLVRYGKELINGYFKGYYVFEKYGREIVIYHDLQIGYTYLIQERNLIITSSERWKGNWTEIYIPTHNGLVDNKWLNTILEDDMWNGVFEDDILEKVFDSSYIFV
jgi:hypothetical protein